MSARHPSGKKLTTPELAAGLRNRASKVRPDDAGSAHWLELAADRLVGLDRELTAQKKAPRPNRRARRALKSKKSTAGMIGDRTPSPQQTPAQVNGYRPKTKPSTLRGGYGTGR